jgi:phosphoribosylformylglycinamidine synthase
VALAECCIADKERLTGADVGLGFDYEIPSRAVLFGEAQGRFVLSTADVDSALDIAAAHGVPARRIGTVTGAERGLRIATADRVLTADVDPLAKAYHGAIPAIMSRPALIAEPASEPILAGV